VADAEWLNDEQKKAYKPYKLGETFPDLVVQPLGIGHRAAVEMADPGGDLEHVVEGQALVCHGHIGEGKIGPGLADNYWTYPQNTTDAGLFSTVTRHRPPGRCRDGGPRR
jgi:hypothetical protein